LIPAPGSAEVCDHCKEPFEKWDKIYRCLDCDGEYHRHCLRKHFTISLAEWVENTIAAIKSNRLDLAILILQRHNYQENCGPTVADAAIQCEGLAVILDVRAGRATEHDHQSGQYGNWLHDSEILRMASRILKRETPSNDQGER
jgi:hypothetical protein